MADRLDQVSLYQIRRAAALSRESRKVSWSPDDALRYRCNFIDMVNHRVQLRGRGFTPLIQGGSLALSWGNPLLEVPGDIGRAHCFLQDQGLHRYYVKPTDHGGWGQGWQWAWRMPDVWNLFIPTVDFALWRKEWSDYLLDGGTEPSPIPV